MKQLDFYNTPGLKGKDLADKRNRAITQQTIIMKFLDTHRDYQFTPENLHDCLFGADTPLTSVRRACTNLEKALQITKTGEKRKGRYDVPVNVYVLNCTCEVDSPRHCPVKGHAEQWMGDQIDHTYETLRDKI